MSPSTRQDTEWAIWPAAAAVAAGVFVLPWVTATVGSRERSFTFAELDFGAEPGIYGVIGTLGVWLIGALSLAALAAIAVARDTDSSELDDDTATFYRAPAWGLAATCCYFAWRLFTIVNRDGGDYVSVRYGVLATLAGAGALVWIAHTVTSTTPPVSSAPSAQPAPRRAKKVKKPKTPKPARTTPVETTFERPAKAVNSADWLEHMYTKDPTSVATRAWQLNRGDRISHRGTPHRIVKVRVNGKKNVTVHLDDATSVMFDYDTFVDVIPD